MPVEVMFDPFSLVLQSFDELYPDRAARLYWTTGLRQERNAYGSTVLKSGSPAQVYIDLGTPVAAAVEVLAHELAHVAAGVDCHDEDDHPPEWQEAFDRIHKLYATKVQDVSDCGDQDIELTPWVSG